MQIEPNPDTEHLRTLIQRYVYTPAMSQDRADAVEAIIGESVRVHRARQETEDNPASDRAPA